MKIGQIMTTEKLGISVMQKILHAPNPGRWITWFQKSERSTPLIMKIPFEMRFHLAAEQSAHPIQERLLSNV